MSEEMRGDMEEKLIEDMEEGMSSSSSGTNDAAERILKKVTFKMYGNKQPRTPNSIFCLKEVEEGAEGTVLSFFERKEQVGELLNILFEDTGLFKRKIFDEDGNFIESRVEGAINEGMIYFPDGTATTIPDNILTEKALNDFLKVLAGVKYFKTARKIAEAFHDLIEHKNTQDNLAALLGILRKKKGITKFLLLGRKAKLLSEKIGEKKGKSEKDSFIKKILSMRLGDLERLLEEEMHNDIDDNGGDDDDDNGKGPMNDDSKKSRDNSDEEGGDEDEKSEEVAKHKRSRKKGKSKRGKSVKDEVFKIDFGCGKSGASGVESGSTDTKLATPDDIEEIVKKYSIEQKIANIIYKRGEKLSEGTVDNAYHAAKLYCKVSEVCLEVDKEAIASICRSYFQDKRFLTLCECGENSLLSTANEECVKREIEAMPNKTYDNSNNSGLVFNTSVVVNEDGTKTLVLNGNSRFYEGNGKLIFEGFPLEYSLKKFVELIRENGLEKATAIMKNDEPSFKLKFTVDSREPIEIRFRKGSEDELDFGSNEQLRLLFKRSREASREGTRRCASASRY